jgi:hypothetical protein
MDPSSSVVAHGPRGSARELKVFQALHEARTWNPSSGRKPDEQRTKWLYQDIDEWVNAPPRGAGRHRWPVRGLKEAVAGCYVIEARDLDAALGIARLNPVMWDGGGAWSRNRGE